MESQKPTKRLLHNGDLKLVLSVLTLGISLVAFAYNNFASKGDIQLIHEKINQFADKDQIREINLKLHRIDESLFDLMKAIQEIRK